MSDNPLVDAPQPILFVFGAARSGTTYLGKLLESFFDYGMGPEGRFVAEFARNLPKYQNLSDLDKLQMLVRDVAESDMLHIMRSKWREEIRTDITPHMILEKVYEPSYAAVVFAVFSCVAEAQGRKHIGNKNPEYWMHLDLLHSLFPTQALYLNIVRDGRDVALSNHKMKWGMANTYASAKRWKMAVESVENFSRRLPRERLLSIRYEDLLDDPLATVEKIEGLCSLRLQAADRERLLAERNSNAKSSNYQKWRQEMPEDEQRTFEAVAGETLDRYGYATCHNATKLTTLKKIRYESEELLRKVRLNLQRVF